MAAKVAGRRLVSTANDVGTSNSATIVSKFPQTVAIEFGWKEERFDNEATIPLLKRRPTESNKATHCTYLIVRLELVLGLELLAIEVTIFSVPYARQTASYIPAAPIPPPTHIVTIPYFALRRGISRSKVAVSLAPVQPSGWPRAMAPPLTFTLAGSMPRTFNTASDCAAKASFSSKRSMSSSERPAIFNTLGM